MNKENKKEICFDGYNELFEDLIMEENFLPLLLHTN